MIDRYNNPILNADWSDPDAISVDGNHYLTASTFNRVPGLPVLHSRDLVHWSLIGHALPHLEPATHFNVPRPGNGVWAPALRHHDGKFWIFYPDPDHGIFVVTATDPAGPWSDPHLLYAGKGLIDPCPLWDEDGQAYLVHGWAKSRSGIKNILTLHRMAPDASRLLDAGTTIIDGELIPGFSTVEGPKLYRHDGWYWVFAPAGGVATGWQSVFRSRSIWGPYEERTTLAQGSTQVNGPHQGAWVTDAAGADWFLHFQDRGRYGRVVHLQPMSWSEDGWPQMGTNVDGHLGAGPGEPVLSYAVPTTTLEAPEQGQPIAGSDSWQAPQLALQWYWQANPDPGWATFPGDGTVRLSALPGDTRNLRELPQVLAQRLPGTPSRTEVPLQLAATTPNTRAGLVVLGQQYAWIGLTIGEDGAAVVTGAAGPQGRSERQLFEPVPLSSRDFAELTICIDVNDCGLARLGWRLDGAEWTYAPGTFAVSAGTWVGADIGIFAAAPIGSAGDGYASFGEFRLSFTPENHR